ncbi:MAG: WD40-repeat-containing domain protein [Monoraphidium minutum]|nr:MAG: WD40-repeat-containing domain protein [Monoraphidium minutum]
MYIDKPPWLVHQEQTFSVDIDTEGARLATSAASGVRVWSLAPILDEAAEQDPARPRLLATLQDHTAPVNVARFSRDGARIASGADDACAIVVERRPGGAAAAAFGGGGGGGAAARNVECWRAVQVLRGHSSNISDLAWSHDDKLLATASVDSTVGVFDVSERPYRLVRFLTGHIGHVKGVAWDPLGSYLASQGDDGVRVWAADGWGQVAHIAVDFEYSSTQMFYLRLSWSPDGQWLAAANAYDKPTQRNHCRIYKRGAWGAESHCFVGHAAPVVAVRPNPRLFHPPLDPKGPVVAAGVTTPRRRPDANGGAPNAGGDAVAVAAEPTTVFALCSLDKQFSVWASARNRAVLVGSRVSKLGILDAAWTPDGFNLVVAALDGFQEDELGRPMSDAAFDAHMRSLYGDPALRAADRPLLEGPEALLAAEAANGGGGAAAARGGGAPRGGGAGRGDALASRVMPQGAGAVTTLPCGKKRIAPTPVGAPPHGGGPSGSAMAPPPPKRTHASPAAAGAAARSLVPSRPPAAAAAAPPAGGAPAAAAAGAAPGQGGGAAAGGGGGGGRGWVFSPPPVLEHLTEGAGTAEHPSALGLQAAAMLEATNQGRGGASPPQARIAYTLAGDRRWSDALRGHVVAMAGSGCILAAGLADGSLLTYHPSGRRALPPLELGAPAVAMAAEGFRLIVLTADGRLVAWDLGTVETLYDVDASPLASPGVGIAHLRLSGGGGGPPLAVLTNGRAHLFSPGLCRWLRVVDSAFQASLHNAALAGLGDDGELDRLLADTAAAAGGPPPPAPSSGAAAAAETRAHLESLMASALVLGQGAAYERWLMAYVEFLAAYTEEQGRLDDLLQDLLGPARWSPLDPASQWQPEVLGLRRRGLLRSALAALARVPPLARYAREAGEQLRDAEAYEAAERAAAAAAAAAGAPPPPPGSGGGRVLGFEMGPDPYADDGGGSGGSGSGGSGSGGGRPLRRVAPTAAAGVSGGGGEGLEGAA